MNLVSSSKSFVSQTEWIKLTEQASYYVLRNVVLIRGRQGHNKRDEKRFQDN